MQMQIKIPSTTLLGVTLLIGTLIVSACSYRENLTLTPEEPAPAEQLGEQVVVISPTEIPEELIPTETDAEDPPIAANEPTEGYPAPGYPVPVPTINLDPYPSPEEAAAPPPVKTELEATDPSSVITAAGKPQLIEFFAFW